jgi:hypothetical protein
MLAIMRMCDFCLMMCSCGAECQAGHWNCKTKPRKSHCCRAVDALLFTSEEEGTSVIVECVLISPWGL